MGMALCNSNDYELRFRTCSIGVGLTASPIIFKNLTLQKAQFRKFLNLS
jgi:hypothetical protein